MTYERTVADERRSIRARRRDPDAALFVAQGAEGVIGRLSIARDDHPASRHVAELGLMVAAEHRRRGVGTALMRAAEDWARETGIRRLELHVLPHNEPAIALYRSLGYEREGYKRALYLVGGRYVDAVLMARMLD